MTRGQKAHASRQKRESVEKSADLAMRLFLEAAAALTNPTEENKVQAFLRGSLALLRLADSDPQGRVLETLMDGLKAAQAPRG